MDRNSALASGGSLIERAARVYDFGAALKARSEERPPAGSRYDDQVLNPRAQAEPVEARLDTLRQAPLDAACGVDQDRQGERIHNKIVLEQELDLVSFDKIEPRRGAIDRTLLAERGFILPDMPAGPLAEEFRIVKRQLLANAAEHGRIILICSARPDEGKTFCAVNLALSMASEKDIEVLLVDADFPKPEILSTLGLAAGPGLLDILADPALDAEQCLIRTDVAGLSVLPAGRHSNDATELLASHRTRAVLGRLASVSNRIVIVDSPPLLAASSASVLADHAGQALLVVRADTTSETELREAVALIDRCAHVRLLLNGVEFGASGRRFGSYYGTEG